jgi:hypothetical protein
MLLVGERASCLSLCVKDIDQSVLMYLMSFMSSFPSFDRSTFRNKCVKNIGSILTLRREFEF